MKKCVLLVGKIGCGKSTLAKALASVLDYSFIEVSDVVKELTGKKRDVIRFNNLTGKIVAKILIKKMNLSQNYVVSGVRQTELVDIIKTYYDTSLFKIVLPLKERYKRTNSREEITYRKLKKEDKLDTSLGLSKVLKLKGYTIKQSMPLADSITLITKILSKEKQ